MEHSVTDCALYSHPYIAWHFAATPVQGEHKEVIIAQKIQEAVEGGQAYVIQWSE